SGRLSPDTFGDRVDRVLGARHRQEIDEAVADLTTRGGVAARLVERVSGFTAAIEAAWREPRTVRLALPAASTDLILGRGPDCDCVLSHPTVSRRHARLRRRGGAWLLTDLGSTNGTGLNGWRVGEEVEVRPGDRVSFGGARFRLTAPE
ncbi:MAG TPA: FHA domain-containing protein, partial [Thermoleophilaceae bacterium]